jgi:hypothetical protein
MINDVISLMLNNYEKEIVYIRQPGNPIRGYGYDQPAKKISSLQGYKKNYSFLNSS